MGFSGDRPFLSVRFTKTVICSVVVVLLRKPLAAVEAVSWLGVVILLEKIKMKGKKMKF